MVRTELTEFEKEDGEEVNPFASKDDEILSECEGEGAEPDEEACKEKDHDQSARCLERGRDEETNRTGAKRPLSKRRTRIRLKER